MKIYGSLASPYVRRVRVLAIELAIPFELVDTMTEVGQAQLRQRSPVWKVPCIELDGEVVVDSHVILDELTRRYGGPLSRVSALSVVEQNRLSFIDTSLDSLVQRFYLRREGISLELPYMEKQLARATSAFLHLEGALPDDEPLFSHFALNLVTAFDWCKLRNAYPVEQHAKLLAFVERAGQRPSLMATTPV